MGSSNRGWLLSRTPTSRPTPRWTWMRRSQTCRSPPSPPCRKQMNERNILKRRHFRESETLWRKENLDVNYFFLPDDRRLRFSACAKALLIQYQRMHFVSQNPAILISFLEK